MLVVQATEKTLRGAIVPRLKIYLDDCSVLINSSP